MESLSCSEQGVCQIAAKLWSDWTPAKFDCTTAFEFDCTTVCQDAANEAQVEDPCAGRSVPLRQLFKDIPPPEWPFKASEELPEGSAEKDQLFKHKQICGSAGCIWVSRTQSPGSSGSRMGCVAPEARDESPRCSARGRGVCRCESSSPVGLCDATVLMPRC